MITREKAWELVKSRCDFALQRHLVHVATAMECVAEHLNHADEKEAWYLTGLLHDIDWNQTIHQPEKHCAEETMIYLRENSVPEMIVEAIQSHYDIYGIQRDTDLKKAIFACDELSGFTVAAALMRPTKMIGIQPKSVIKKMKDKAFAAAVSREDMKTCELYFDIQVSDFLTILIPSFEKIAPDWQLT